MKSKVDLFTAIHKAIRAMLYDMATKLQFANLVDDQERGATLGRLEHMLELLEDHAHHEDHLIFPPIEAVAPGATDEAESQHRGYEEREARLRHIISQIREAAGPAERLVLANTLNRVYADFLAFYLMHLNCEEETILPVSQEKLSDEELTAIRVKIQVGTSPERYAEWMHWMLPSLSINELAPLFSQVKASAPAPIFEKIRQIGEKTIDAQRWNQVCELAEIA